MSSSAPPPARSRLVNQLPYPGMPLRRCQTVRAAVDLAEEAGRGVGLGGDHGRREAEVGAHAEHLVLGRRLGEHALGFGIAQGHRLFTEHVAAGFQRRQGHGRVKDIGRGDHGDVGFDLREHFFVVAIDGGDADLVGQLLRARGVHIAEGDDFGVGQAIEARPVAVLGDAACADDGDAVGIGFAHDVLSFGLVDVDY